MVSSPVSRRRSERFADLLDTKSERRGQHRRGALDQELSELVRLARRTAKVRVAPAPDPEFRDGLRAMLMAKIERDGIGATAAEKAARQLAQAALAGKTQVVAQVPSPGPGRTRAAVLVGVTVGALALSGVSAASSGALRGDPLYPVKRSSESAQLALAGSDLSRGQLQLEFARIRLSEASKVDSEHIGATLADMDDATRNATRLLTGVAVQRQDPAVLDIVLRFVTRQIRLIELSDTLPTRASKATAKSTELLHAVRSRAQALKAALNARCTTDFTLDDLGPAPASSGC